MKRLSSPRPSRVRVPVLGALLAAAALLAAGGPTTARAQNAPEQLPFQNPDLPVAQRVDDLVGRMTLEEKVSQMTENAAAIPRLGVPAYYWWNEALHGVARAGVATVFPQAVGLASTWDVPLHHQIADVISTEARAKHHDALAHGRHGIYEGLTFWSPNINIFRDPRWGRGQETYGEDPFLTGRFGVAFVQGMQGDDPRYLKTVATAKHFAVHSGPEPDRHHFDVLVSKYDLNDTYLPAFAALIKEGHARSVMGAYNRLYGEPACASPLLLQHYLRDQWGFDGYVVSDCGAITDIYANHKYAKNAEEASALAVKAGCDLACDGAYRSLVGAVRHGLIAEGELDRSVKRLFTERFKLGMFDPPSRVPYAQIPMSVVDSEPHRQLALRAARESIVLLKNERNTLPLSSSIKSLAVIGPNADSVPVLVGNYNGDPAHPVTVLAGLRKRAEAAGIKVEYAQGTPLVEPRGTLQTIPGSALRSSGQPGLKAEYFANETLQGTAVTQREAQVEHRWGGAAPVTGIPGTHFSARWTGELVAPAAGKYTLGVRGDDGYRLWLGDEKVIDDWSLHAPSQKTFDVILKKGQMVPLRLEYYQGEQGAEVSLQWHTPAGAETAPFSDALALTKRSDAVIYVCGLTAQIEGEEGENGTSDRTTLDLPGKQEALLEALQKTGKPVIVVSMSGSALSLNWAAKHVPAILHAWYPGEEGGTAVADVLFGDYNPAGRLPVTFYQSAAQLPAFDDYTMNGRTYRYFTGEPLYGFGYGLSYTSFRYSDLNVPAQAAPGKPVSVTAAVENTGGRDGDEVAELYLRPAPDRKEAERRIDAGQPMPRLVLAGFQRVHLKAGERRTVTFTLTPEQLLLVDANGERTLQPGAWRVFVGGRQPRPERRQEGILTADLAVR